MIATGLLAPGAKELTPSQGKGVNRTLRGQVYLLDGNSVTAYVKLLQPKQFANELLAGLLARLVGLPAPANYLVKVVARDYPALPWSPGVTEAYAFGSQACPGQPVARRFLGEGPAFLRWFVDSVRGWRRCVAFDVWVGNGDRHLQNLLLDGTTAWLIDHGHCFTGPDWSATDLIPGRNCPSRLLGDLGAFVTVAHRQQVMMDTAEVKALCDVTDLSGALQDAGVERMLTAAEMGAVLLYLEARRRDLCGLVGQQVGFPVLQIP
jgi:hypothetical protein